MSMRLRQHHIANNWPTPSLITPDLQSSVRYWRPHAVPPLSVKPPYRKVAWRFGRGFRPYPLPDAAVPLGKEFINGKGPLLRSFRLRQPPEPLQTSVSSNSVPVPAVMSGTSNITSTFHGAGRLESLPWRFLHGTHDFHRIYADRRNLPYEVDNALFVILKSVGIEFLPDRRIFGILLFVLIEDPF